MKTDIYTKVVLTIIAICLSVLVFKDINIIPQVQASPSDSNIGSASLNNYTMIPVNEDGSINVHLSATETLDVNIREIDTYDELRIDLRSINTSDELDINLDEIGGGWLSNGGPIPVKVEQ